MTFGSSHWHNRSKDLGKESKKVLPESWFWKILSRSASVTNITNQISLSCTRNLFGAQKMNFKILCIEKINFIKKRQFYDWIWCTAHWNKLFGRKITSILRDACFTGIFYASKSILRLSLQGLKTSIIIENLDSHK